MDRLGRKVDDLPRLVRELTGRGVHVQFMKEQPTFTAEASAWVLAWPIVRFRGLVAW